jgi:hypothetical protein
MKRRGVYLYCAHAAPGDADPVWEAVCLRWWWGRLLSVVWPIAIGGKPPPTGVCGVRYVLAGRQSRARSDRFGLCRPGDADPVWEVVCLRWWWSACSVLSGPSLSGASPLPQGYAVCVMSWRAGNSGRGRTGFGPCRSDDADPVWEGACLRWWWSACSVLSGPSLSGASPLPQGYAVCVMSWRAGNPGRGRTGFGPCRSDDADPVWEGASPLPQGYAVCVMSWRAGNSGRGRTGFGPCRSDDAGPVWEGACPRWRRVSRHHN